MIITITNVSKDSVVSTSFGSVQPGQTLSGRVKMDDLSSISAQLASLGNRIKYRVDMDDPGVPNELEPPMAQPPITSAMTLFVSVDGNDSNLGTSASSALRTVEEALKRISNREITATVTINIGAGNFGSLTLPSGLRTAGAGQVNIIGTFELATLTTGSASGTATSSAAGSVTNSAAEFTASDLKGKFLAIGTTLDHNNIYPITANTETSIKYSNGGEPAANTPYRVCQPGTIFKSGAAPALRSNTHANVWVWRCSLIADTGNQSPVDISLQSTVTIVQCFVSQEATSTATSVFRANGPVRYLRNNTIRCLRADGVILHAINLVDLFPLVSGSVERNYFHGNGTQTFVWMPSGMPMSFNTSCWEGFAYVIRCDSTAYSTSTGALQLKHGDISLHGRFINNGIIADMKYNDMSIWIGYRSTTVVLGYDVTSSGNTKVANILGMGKCYVATEAYSGLADTAAITVGASDGTLGDMRGNDPKSFPEVPTHLSGYVAQR